MAAMTVDRIFGQIYTEIDAIKRRLDQTVESVAFEHTGDGVPAHTASEGVLYWDYTNDDLYVNTSGAAVWQIVGGASSAANHNMLSATHLDSTAAAVTRGALIIGQGASPTWKRRDHPSGINFYLRSNAAEPDWTDNVTLSDGKFVGITGDLQVLFNVSGGKLTLSLGDAAGNDKVWILDSTSTNVAYIDSNGNADFAGHLGVGNNAAVSSVIAIDIQETSVNTTSTYRGLYIAETKTAGATDHNDHFYGEEIITTLNHTGGEIGHLYGIRIENRLTDGSVGDGSNARDAYGQYIITNLDAGTVEGNSYGQYVIVDQEAGNTTEGDIRAFSLTVDALGTVNGTTFMLYLYEINNVDYTIYHSGTAKSHLGGRLSVGGTILPLAQLHVDQSSGSGGIPVALLDQGHSGQSHILCSMNGADQDYVGIIELDVTGDPKLGWIENDDSFYISHSLIINGTAKDSNITAELHVMDGHISTSNDGNAAIVNIYAYGNDAGDIPSIRQRRARGTRGGSEATVSAADVLGRVGAGGYDGSAFVTTSSGYVQWEAAETWNGSAHGTRARFYVTANSATTETMAFEISNNAIGYFPYGVRTVWSENNVSSPPTDAELDTAFGTPATVREGFLALVDDNNAATAGWLVASLGAAWWYVALTKAT